VLGWQWENLMDDAVFTCSHHKVVSRSRYFESDRDPYSYSGPTCHGWGNARPDFCNDHYQKIEE